MNYKLVVLDMDGTLLNGKNRVPRKNRDAIKNLMERGVQFVVASGRPYESIVPYAKNLCIDLPIISANGALVKSPRTNEVYFSSSLPGKWVEEILLFAQETTFAVSLYLEDEILSFDKNMIDLHNNLEGLEAKKIENFAGNQPVLKILMANQPDIVAETIKRFEKKYRNELYVTSSEPYFLEVMNVNASKGIALKQLMKKLDVSSEEVVVMGNNFNDIPMFDVAGVAVAMANSPHKVQKVSDFVTKSNIEDGVAFALNYLFKGGFK